MSEILSAENYLAFRFVFTLCLPTLWLARFLTAMWSDDLTWRHWLVLITLTLMALSMALTVGSAALVASVRLAQTVAPADILPTMQCIAWWILFWTVPGGVVQVLLEEVVSFLWPVLKRVRQSMMTADYLPGR